MNAATFAIFVLVATIGIVGVVGVQFSGMAVRTLYDKHVSCHYVSTDPWGQCIIVERQPGIACNPPEDDYKYKTRYGWFIRPCSTEKKF